jgi:hypothetical protein
MRLIQPNMHAMVEATGPRLTGGALLALLMLGHGANLAAQASERAALHVDADARCATSEGLAERVRARSSRIVFEHGAPIALHVAITPQPNGELSAELQVVWPDGRRSTRGLSAPSCAAAADALAFLITLTLDPSSVRAQPEATDAPAKKRARQAQPSPAPEAPAPEPIATPSVQPSQQREPHPAAGRAQPSHAERFAFSHAALGLVAQGTLGPAPRSMPGVALLGQLAWQGELPWAPLLQLRIGRSWLATERSAGVAHFRLDAAQLAACPIGVRSSRFAAHACASFELGSLSARGSETYEPRSHARLWLSFGTALLFSLRLAGPLELQLGAGLFWPLRRDSFAFAPAVFHRVAGTCGQAHAGLAVRFP